MNTASSWNIKSIVGKVMVALVMATMIGAISVLPAHSDDDERRIERRDDDHYEHRGRGHNRRYYNDRRYYDNGRRYYRAPVYRERVYVEPQVIYAPPRPTGISIFLPPLFFGN